MRFPLLTRTLDRANGRVPFFFRDDDAGWGDAELRALCSCFRSIAPLDLAVIPMAIDPTFATMLAASDDELRFHQHGYAHVNHQRRGKKCELSDDRDPEAVGAEIRMGHERLRDVLGDRLDPIFTPPWNRCGVAAVRALDEMGVRVLSRDSGAAAIDHPGVIELPVTSDWERARADLDVALAAAVGQPPVGVMLHHQLLSADDLDVIDELLAVLSAHPNAELCSMMSLADSKVSP